MLNFLKKLFVTLPQQDRIEPESQFLVTFNDQSITCTQSNGDEQAVTWNELRAVVIETNATGPWGSDIWWILIGQGASARCAFPQGATGDSELLAKLQELPDFDNEALIAAMSSVENNRFLCWQAPT